MNDTLLATFIYNYFKIIGLAPMTYIPKKSFRPSKHGAIYNMFLMIGIFSISYCAIDICLSGNIYPEFDLIVYTAQKIISGLICLFLVFVPIHCQKNNVIVLYRLKALNDLLTNKDRLTITTVLKENCLLNLLTWLPLLEALPITIISLMNRFETASLIFDAYVCWLIVAGNVVQYSLVLVMIKRLFKLVNDQLIEVRSFKRCSYIYIRDQLSRLKKLHSELVKISEDIDELYSKSMLMCIFYIFSTVTVAAYYVVKPLVLIHRLNQLPSAIALNCILVVHGMAIIYLLASTATAVIKEVNFFNCKFLRF